MWFKVWRSLLVLSICGLIISVGRIVGADSDTFMVHKIEAFNALFVIMAATFSVRIKPEDVA